MAEEEDPFGSLIKLCELTSSQELELQNCPFARESEAFAAMDSDDTPSVNHTPTEVTGIIMVSAPETDSDQDGQAIDENTPHENEIFQTPPEHHNRRSSSSSQEFLSQREKPVDVVIDVMEETTCLDDDVHLGGEQNLGCSETVDLSEGDGVVGARCLENVNDVAGIVGSGTELKRFRVSNDKLGELSSKKIRVSEENWGWDTQCVDEAEMIDEEVNCTQVIDLECEETHAGLLDKGQFTVHVDSSAKDLEVNVGTSGTVLDAQAKCVKTSHKFMGDGSDSVLEERMEEKAMEEDSAEQCPRRNVDSALEKSVGVKDIRKKQGATRVKVDSPAKDLEKNVGFMKHVELLENVIPTLNCESRRVEDTKKPIDYSSDGGVVDKEKGDERCLMDMVDVPQKAYVEKCGDDVHQNAQNDVNGPSGRKGVKEIESFRYEGSGADTNYPTKERASKQRRELPFSLRGKENDTQGEDKGRNVKMGKGSWQELIDALEIIFKVDESCEDVDFLETAKRRGLTFPQPRWL